MAITARKGLNESYLVYLLDVSPEEVKFVQATDLGKFYQVGSRMFKIDDGGVHIVAGDTLDIEYSKRVWLAFKTGYNRRNPDNSTPAEIPADLEAVYKKGVEARLTFINISHTLQV